MLQRTFQHIHGVGPVAEMRLWEAGAHDWESALEMPHDVLNRPESFYAAVEESQERLADNDLRWFYDRVSTKQRWRFLPHARNSMAYVDIETDGRMLDRGGIITAISLWDGDDVRNYVNGENLRDFGDHILDYDTIVTWNGSSFDIPIIEEWYRTTLPLMHIDLRHVFRQTGFKGGLKRCEEAYGIDRGDLKGVDGWSAVQLWRKYQTFGDAAALETLLEYNAMDVVHLEHLFGVAFNLLVGETPFADSDQVDIEIPPPPYCFSPDTETVAELNETKDDKKRDVRAIARSILGTGE